MHSIMAEFSKKSTKEKPKKMGRVFLLIPSIQRVGGCVLEALAGQGQQPFGKLGDRLLVAVGS